MCHIRWVMPLALLSPVFTSVQNLPSVASQACQQDFLPCSLALVGSQDCMHFYSLSVQQGTGHARTATLPLENTSAGLAARCRRPVYTSKLGTR